MYGYLEDTRRSSCEVSAQGLGTGSKVRKPRDGRQDLAGPGSRIPGTGNRNHMGANGFGF